MEVAFINYSCFSIFSSRGHFVYPSETVSALLVKERLSNIPMKSEGGISI